MGKHMTRTKMAHEKKGTRHRRIHNRREHDSNLENGKQKKVRRVGFRSAKRGVGAGVWDESREIMKTPRNYEVVSKYPTIIHNGRQFTLHKRHHDSGNGEGARKRRLKITNATMNHRRRIMWGGMTQEDAERIATRIEQNIQSIDTMLPTVSDKTMKKYLNALKNEYNRTLGIFRTYNDYLESGGEVIGAVDDKLVSVDERLNDIKKAITAATAKDIIPGSELAENNISQVELLLNSLKVQNDAVETILATKSEMRDEPVATEPVVEPVAEPVAKPVPEPVAEPVTEPVVEPATEPVVEPVAKPVPEPATEPVAEPVVEPVAEPVAKPVPEPVAEPVTEPVVEPATEPVVEPVAKPVPEPATEPVAEPVVEPVAKPVPEPATEPATEPVAEPVTKPVVEPMTKPATEPVTEPVTEPASASVTATASVLPSTPDLPDKTIADLAELKTAIEGNIANLENELGRLPHGDPKIQKLRRQILAENQKLAKVAIPLRGAADAADIARKLAPFGARIGATTTIPIPSDGIPVAEPITPPEVPTIPIDSRPYPQGVDVKIAMSDNPAENVIITIRPSVALASRGTRTDVVDTTDEPISI